MWNAVNDKSIIMPSCSSKILVTDGENISITTVGKFLDNVDKAWCPWKYWMPVPELPE